MKVIEHRKKPKPVKVPKERKPKRYRVEEFMYAIDEWRYYSEHTFRWAAIDQARTIERNERPHTRMRVVDTRKD